ncbi:MAG: putative Ig domain-containing protein, partial [Solimonas sp.]
MDASKLPAWAMRQTGDYSAAKWSDAELSGYLVLSQAGAPDVAVSWMLMARRKTSITKLSSTMHEGFNSEFWTQYLGIDGTLELTQDFRNDNSLDADFAVYPIVARVDYPQPDKQNAGGNMLHYVGARVFDEAQCTSGKKLSIAASFFSPAPIALANYYDRGTQLLYWEIKPDIFSGTVTTEYMGYGWVEINAAGQPFTTYVDLTIPFDPNNPTGRYRTSKLPAKMASHTRNVVSEVCLDELYHDDVTSPEAFNGQLSWVFSTDRDAIPRQQFDFFAYNPVRPGYDALLRRPDGAPDNYVERLTAGSGQSLTLTGAKVDSFGPFSEGPLREENGFLLMSLGDDYALFSPVAYNENSVMATARAGQSFNVREDAAGGTVVGHIETDVEQFFGIGTAQETYELVLAGAVPGDPFTLTRDGDIVLSNPSGLDHEMADTLTLSVRAAQGQALGAIVDVTVHVLDVNDNAPLWIASSTTLPDAATRTPYSVALADSFRDLDGTPLSYAATGLPAGLTVDALTGSLHGTPEKEGDYTVTVSADDGEHQTSQALSLKVRSTGTDGGGGGGGGGAWTLPGTLLLMLAAA